MLAPWAPCGTLATINLIICAHSLHSLYSLHSRTQKSPKTMSARIYQMSEKCTSAFASQQFPTVSNSLQQLPTASTSFQRCHCSCTLLRSPTTLDVLNSARYASTRRLWHALRSESTSSKSQTTWPPLHTYSIKICVSFVSRNRRDMAHTTIVPRQYRRSTNQARISQ